jgi:pimeloyl-ACP methyl ester carboxylesterase
MDRFQFPYKSFGKPSSPICQGKLSPGPSTIGSSEKDQESLEKNLHLNHDQATQSRTLRIPLSHHGEASVTVTPGMGTPILFLYGLSSSRSQWNHQLAHLRDLGRLTIAMDYRGMGASELGDAPRPLTIERLAIDLLTVLNTLNVEEVVICGHSIGSAVALLFGQMAPRILKGLVLLGGAGKTPYKSSRERGGRPLWTSEELTRVNYPLERLLQFFRSKDHDVSHASAVIRPLLVRFPFLRPLARELVRHGQFNAALVQSEAIEALLTDVWQRDEALVKEMTTDYNQFNLGEFPQSVDCPALVLAGSQDRFVAIEEMRWVARRLPLSEFEIIPHGGHLPQLEDPTLVNQRLVRFLDTYHL